MLENTEVAIENGESRETGNQGYTRHKTKTHKTKTQHNMGWTPLYHCVRHNTAKLQIKTKHDHRAVMRQ